MDYTLQGDDFRVWYDATCATVVFEGLLKLPSLNDYDPISSMLDASKNQSNLTMDLRKLEFLNSSGISMLSRFVVKLRHERNTQLCIQGSQQVFWQTRSLKNLQRLMPNLSVEWD
jgi:hypothetical protein